MSTNQIWFTMKLKYIYIYIFSNCHWFFNPECQHIFRKQTRYIFQVYISVEILKTITQHNMCGTPHALYINNINKACVLLQTTGGKDESIIVIMRKL
jgi:hypothetical protein